MGIDIRTDKYTADADGMRSIVGGRKKKASVCCLLADWSGVRFLGVVGWLNMCKAELGL
jgi:hypothetical protein